MEHNRKPLIFLVAAAALLLSAAACHSQSPGSSGYVPTSTSSLPGARNGDTSDMGAKDNDIKSTCGDRVHIVLLGFVDCKFKETGYDGRFRVFNHTKGLVGISPSSGTSATTFTITGLILGRGAFLIKDHRGNHLLIRVHVTTL
jgi:hypothetical protein